MTSGWDTLRKLEGKTIERISAGPAGRPVLEFTDGTAVMLIERFGSRPCVRAHPISDTTTVKTPDAP